MAVSAPGDARGRPPRPALARRLLSLGRRIFLRTASLIGAFVLAGAVAARFGDASLGAHQIAFQLWIFLALVLDAVAIAGQIIVGRELGAGPAGARLRRERSHDLALGRGSGAVFAAALALGVGVIPRVFTGDAATLDEATLLWPLFALMLPFAGAVFALDGILIGASDGPYLAGSMLAAFARAPPLSESHSPRTGASAVCGRRSCCSSSCAWPSWARGSGAAAGSSPAGRDPPRGRGVAATHPTPRLPEGSQRVSQAAASASRRFVQ